MFKPRPDYIIGHLVQSSRMSIHLAKSVCPYVGICPSLWAYAKTATKQPKMIGFRIFKCPWNHLDEPDPTMPIT